jgi:hypothetical protein
MRRNLDLIIILTLSVLVCGVLYLLYDSTNDFSVSKKNNITMSRGSGSRVIPRGSVNGGIWTPEGVSGGLSSSRSVRVSPQSYRRSSMQATSTNSSLVSSSRSLMSNRSANTVSIVGGNTANFGRTAEANMSQPLAYSGGAGYPSVNVPSMRSANPVVASAPAYVGAGVESMSAPYQSFSSLPNYGGSNPGLSILGGVPYDHTATASPLRAGGQLRAPGTMGNSWGNWLDGSGYDSGKKEEGENGKIIIDREDAEAIWKDMMDNKGEEDDDTNSWNEGMGQGATWESFLAWLEKNGGTSKYKYVPVGDIAPLFLLAFAYLAMLLIRRKTN